MGRERPSSSYHPLRDALERAEVGMARVAPDSSILRANQKLAELLEYTVDELLALRFRALLHPDDLLLYIDATNALSEERNESFGIETRMLAKSGATVRVRLTAYIVRRPNGREKFAVMIVEDITERRRLEENQRQLMAEAAIAQAQAEDHALLLEAQAVELEEQSAELAASERELRALVDSMRDVILILDNTGRYLRIPSTAADLLYAPIPELLGRRIHDVLPATTADAFLAAIREALALGDAIRLDYNLPIAGRTVWFSAVISPMSNDQVLWVARDVTLLKEAAEAALASEKRYRLLFEANPLPMWVYDRATLRFLSVNDAALRQYGYTREEFMSMTLLDIRPPEDAERLRAAVKERNDLQRSMGWRHIRKDGTIIDVEIVAHGIELDGADAELIVAQDVTEQKRIEQQLRQAQKMEAVGQLAGGIAHDFNNMLTAIVSYSDLILEAARGNQLIYDDVMEIKRAADRAGALTRQLLTFSRQQIVRTEVVPINDVVAPMKKFLGRMVREDIRIEVTLDPEQIMVEADPGQIEQVLMNLVVNARDAMEHGGTLWIETSNTVRDGQRYAVLCVTDTGTGMTADVRQRIFEPFFTTKEPGSGTGLGLAIVHGIVEQADGWIEVDSEPGAGTTFRVYLPSAEAAKAAAPRPASDRSTPRGSEVVLLVEDDDAVRAVAARVLRKQGYTVLEASNGKDALDIFERRGHEAALVITDMVMPTMSGTELAARLRSRAPTLPILFVSGYSRDAADQIAQVETASEYLEKPFTPATLAATVRALLDSTRKEAAK